MISPVLQDSRDTRTESGANQRARPGAFGPPGAGRDHIEQEGFTTLFRRRLRGMLALAFAISALGMAVPGALAARGLALTTSYPAITVSPGSQVSFDLNVSAAEAARVDLSLSGAPAAWNAAMRGGGNIVSAVTVDGTEPTVVRLDMDVPDDATGTTRMTVTATSTGTTVTLPIEVSVSANASGSVAVEPDSTALRGAADDSFTFNLTVSNDTEQDLAFSATAQPPAGWDADVTYTGQTQAVTGTVDAGGTSNIAIAVTAADAAAAGEYAIPVVATVGGQQYPLDLKVEVTGSYDIVLTTPGDLLSMRGASGSVSTQVFTITNAGTAPLSNVVMTATAPTNWTVEFEPETSAQILPGANAQITATITPTSGAIAGDYNITFTARAEEGSDQALVRFTVETSIIGAIIGAALIVAAVGGLLWVFRRYGRR